ncbi:acyltransferase [candidate division KSB3 bacterium]|nr:acyltransferase [candidate division KSB3 bacterium]
MMEEKSLITHKKLKALHRSLRDEIVKKWNRVLSFHEEIADRWEKAKYLGFGEGTSIYDSSLVFGDVRVGEHTWIGPFTILDGRGGLKIGSYCSISTGVQIYTHDSVRWAVSGGKTKYAVTPVEIGDCCYVGPNVVITKGVKIGNHCVIGANSFVNKNVPDYSVVFGCPGKVKGRVIIHEDGSVDFEHEQRAD